MFLVWNAKAQAYIGSKDGEPVHVEASEMQEACQAVGINVEALSQRSAFYCWEALTEAEQQLLDPANWDYERYWK